MTYISGYVISKLRNNSLKIRANLSHGSKKANKKESKNDNDDYSRIWIKEACFFTFEYLVDMNKS